MYTPRRSRNFLNLYLQTVISVTEQSSRLLTLFTERKTQHHKKQNNEINNLLKVVLLHCTLPHRILKLTLFLKLRKCTCLSKFLAKYTCTLQRKQPHVHPSVKCKYRLFKSARVGMRPREARLAPGPRAVKHCLQLP